MIQPRIKELTVRMPNFTGKDSGPNSSISNKQSTVAMSYEAKRWNEGYGKRNVAVAGVAAAQLCGFQAMRGPVPSCPANCPLERRHFKAVMPGPLFRVAVGYVSCVNNIPSDATQGITKCHNANILAHVVKPNPWCSVSMGSTVWKRRGP